MKTTTILLISLIFVAIFTTMIMFTVIPSLAESQKTISLIIFDSDETEPGLISEDASPNDEPPLAPATEAGDTVTTYQIGVEDTQESFCGLPESAYNVIRGTNNAEIIVGTDNDDLILALNGNDYVRAGDGNDCIVAGHGDDYVDAGKGDDTILAGAGNDNIRTGSGNDTVYGSMGDDIILAFSKADVIDGGAGKDICAGGVTQNCEATNQNYIVAPTPVPANAIGQAIPEKGYFVEEINDGLYWVTDGLYQAMFLVSDDGVILVDAPPSIGQNLVNAISDVTTQSVTHFVYSHHHADHVDAAHLFSDATFIAQSEAAQKLAKINDPDRPIPDVTFDENYTLTVGNQTLHLSYPGTNHSPGNIFAYAPQQKVLMLVDVVFPGWTPFKDLAIAEDVPAFIEIHDDILKFDFDVLVSGHLTRLGTPEDVQAQKEYITDIQNNLFVAVSTVNFADAFTRSANPQDVWLVFDDYLDEVTSMCADMTIPKWRDTLGAVETFTITHCDTLFDSLRVD